MPTPARLALLKGLYVLLDPSVFGTRNLPDVLQAAADAGACLFQYRDKAASMKEAYRQAVSLRQASADVGALLIIDDRCDLALAVDADGVQLGQDDLPLRDARALMGGGKLIGISTHNLIQVEEATEGGADYLGFGPIFETGTKRDHEPLVGIDGLRSVRARTTLPIFAIGGLTVESAALAKQAGADGVAVASAIAKAVDVGHAVRAFITALR